MLQQTKKFITESAKAQNLDASFINFLLKENKTQLTQLNIKISKNKIDFDEIRNFHQIYNYSLTREEANAYDLFNDFRTPKNAVNCILTAIETKTAINEDTFRNQTRLTAKNWEDFKSCKYFNEFYELLEDKQSFLDIATNWINFEHQGKNSFDFFALNDGSIKSGDYMQGYDPLLSSALYTRIFATSENGFLLSLDNGGFFTLPKAANAQKISGEQIPTEIRESLDETYSKFDEEVEILQNKVIEKESLKAERQKEAEIKAAAKLLKEQQEAEAEVAKAEAAKDLFKKLHKTKLETKDHITNFAKSLNEYLPQLAKAQISDLKTKLSEAKKALGIEPRKAPKAQPTTAAPQPNKAPSKPFEMDIEELEALTKEAAKEAPKKATKGAKPTEASEAPEAPEASDKPKRQAPKKAAAKK